MPGRRDAREVVQQHAAVRVCVDVGRVGHIIAGLLHPTDERVLPGEKGLAIDVAGAIPLVGPVEGNLHGVLASAYRRRAIAVEGVEALAGGVVIRIVVVSLIGRYGLLVEEGGDSAVVANDKHDVVLIRLRVGQ